MNIEFETFKEEDIPELTQIMTRAFNYDSKLHLHKESGGPEGYDDGSFLRKYGFDRMSTQYKILLDQKVIGATILWLDEKNQRGFLGCLFIDVPFENQGIGAAVWQKIETLYPNIKVWGTETPAFSVRNHHFYINKCKFHLVRIDEPKSLEKGSYIFEKRMV